MLKLIPASDSSGAAFSLKILNAFPAPLNGLTNTKILLSFGSSTFDRSEKKNSEVNHSLLYINNRPTVYSPPLYMGASLTQLSCIMTRETTHHHTVNIYSWLWTSNQWLCNVYKQKSSNELYETLSCNFILLIAVKLRQSAGNYGHSAD